MNIHYHHTVDHVVTETFAHVTSFAAAAAQSPSFATPAPPQSEPRHWGRLPHKMPFTSAFFTPLRYSAATCHFSTLTPDTPLFRCYTMPPTLSLTADG